MRSDDGGGPTGAGLGAPPPGLVRFIDAKMSRPRRVRAAVPRRRLIDQLDAAIGKPVTLVCAGAGWGKTMLVSAR